MIEFQKHSYQLDLEFWCYEIDIVWQTETKMSQIGEVTLLPLE